MQHPMPMSIHMQQWISELLIKISTDILIGIGGQTGKSVT